MKKKKNIKTIIRQIVREEVAMAINEVITELKQPTKSQPQSKKIVEKKSFTKISFTGHPSTEYGDVKNGSYSYTSVANTYDGSNPYYIEDVTVSKFSERAQQQVPGEIKVGFIDFEVSTARFPRS